nr:hypothetical protein [Tanacetum cinerariifolium]
MDKSWMGTIRTNKYYVDGIATFIDYAVHNLQKMGNINLRVNKQHLSRPCSCTTCLNYIEHKVEEVQFHLFRNRIDLSYTNWTRHGEKDEPSISALKHVNATTEFVDNTNFALDIPTDGPATVEMVNAIKDNFDEDDLVKFQELLLDAEKPLYEGCPDFTKLSAIVKLLNLKGYKKIHVCINNCLLYWKDDKDLTACQTCGISRWKVDNKTHKVYENIPAKAWRTIDEKFPKIAEDLRNIQLEISANRVDVNTRNRHHTVWPVLTAIYNLPPWLCMKRNFIMLSVLISGYPRNDIDVFLELLVNDLHTLFETGVDTYDVSTKDNCNLRAVVLWTINDYPPLGTLCGCPYIIFKEKNVAESLVETLLHVSRKTKDGVNARLDLAELGGQTRVVFYVIKGHVRNRNKPEGYIAEETITEETIEFFSEYHKSMETIGIPPDKHETDENEEGKLLSAGKSSEVSTELFQKAHLYVERELAISKESVSETVRWISYGPRATVVKYDAYNINGYTFHTKCHDGKVYQNSGISVEAIDLHISKEVATTRQAFYCGVLQEIQVLDYRFRQIPLFKCDWVNHRVGGVKRDNIGYTLVDLNNLGHKVDPFILASQARQVVYCL